MSNLRKCSRCRSEIELKYFAINRKGEYNKTCETCLSKNRKAKPASTVPSNVSPLKRTDTDFVNGFEPIYKEMGGEQVSDTKINTFAKLLVHLDITRPCGDDVFNDPAKASKLIYVSDKRLALLKQIDELDVSAQQKIGKRYRELAEEYNASLDEIQSTKLS